MEEEVLKNQFINEFLENYNKKDWNDIVVKVLKIGLLSIKKNIIKKNVYSLNDLDNLIKDLEKNNDNVENKNIKNINKNEINNIKDLNEEKIENNEEEIEKNEEKKENIEDKKENKEEEKKKDINNNKNGDKNKKEYELNLQYENINLNDFDLKYNYNKIFNQPSSNFINSKSALNSFRNNNGKYFNIESRVYSPKYTDYRDEKNKNISIKFNNPNFYKGKINSSNLNYDYNKFSFKYKNQNPKKEPYFNKTLSRFQRNNPLYKPNYTDI
jgi:hypothetical protein